MKSRRPNVLWLYCDELRADALACYGNDRVPVQTPHLDRLAQQGALFNNTFCNSPICVASRASILTGTYPQQNGVYSNEGCYPQFKHDLGLTTFPQVFAQHGYTTATFGKSHVPACFQPWQHENRQGGAMGDPWQAMPDSFREHPWHRSTFAKSVPADVAYPPNMVAANTIQFLQDHRNDDNPWLVRASWLQPHTPVVPPLPWGDMYMHCDFDIRRPDVSKLSMTERRWIETWDSFPQPPDAWRAVQLRYYGLVSWMDSQVGQILAALDVMGMSENTVVAFTADHGCMAGDWGVTAKNLFHHYSHRVPLIIRAPGMQGDVVRDDINQSLDLAKTLFGLAEIEPETDQFQGRNLFGEQPPEAVFATIGFGEKDSYLAPNAKIGTYPDGHGWPRRTCVRTAQFRFEKNVRIDGGPVPEALVDPFLCDLQSDPNEIINRANDPTLQNVAERLSKMIDAHVADSVEVATDQISR